MRKYLALLVIPVLSACSGGGEGSSSHPNSIPDQQPVNPLLEVSLEGESSIQKDGSLALSLNAENLSNDDALYVSVSGFDTNALEIKPSSALIYPTDGKALINLAVNELDMINDQNIQVEVTTSQGDKKLVSHSLSVAQ